jgi:hypothetical protein
MSSLVLHQILKQMIMNQKIILLLGIVFTLSLNAQENADSVVPLDEEGTIRYIKVIQQDEDAQQLFKNCVKWINKSYKNPSVATTTRDMVNKKIVIRHQFRLKKTNEDGIKIDNGMVMYDLTIRFREGRYRAEMTNFILKSASKFPAENWLPGGLDPNPENLRQLNEFALNLLKDLKQGMYPEQKYEEEDW